MSIIKIEAALDDIRQGKMVILVDDEDYENKDSLIVKWICNAWIWYLVLLLTLILGSSSNLYAAEEGRFAIRGGPILVKADSGGDLKLDGAPVPGISLELDDELYQGVFLTWQVSREFSLETIVSTPLELDVQAKGRALNSSFSAIEVDLLPLMLIGRYNPPVNWYGVRPFVGVGAAYLWFSNVKTTEAFDEFGNSFGLQNPKVNFNNKFSPVLELGLDYLVGNHWFVNATWLYLKWDDEVTVTYSNGVKLTSEVSCAPQFLAITVGYRF